MKASNGGQTRGWSYRVVGHVTKSVVTRRQGGIVEWSSRAAARCVNITGVYRKYGYLMNIGLKGRPRVRPWLQGIGVPVARER
jgi:hypothetical protein